MIPGLVVDDLRRSILSAVEASLALDDGHAAAALRQLLADPEHGLFRGPFLSLSLPLGRALPDAASDVLQFCPGFVPYLHQLETFKRLASRQDSPRSTLITGGRGAGAGEAILFPLLDHCLRQIESPGIKAIVVYPSRDVACDHGRRLAGMIWNDPRLRGKVRAGLYTGSTNESRDMGPEHLISSRDSLRKFRPDILLAHAAELGLLLRRAEDARIWRDTGPDSLRYLVLPELQRYDPVQALELACLLRRLKARLGIERGTLCCVGTCAPLVDDAQAPADLIALAESLFGEPFASDCLVQASDTDLEAAFSDPAVEDARPGPEADLRPGSDAQAEYLRRLRGFWFPELEGSFDALALGSLVLRHPVSRTLQRCLAAAPAEPIPLADVCARLAAVDSGFASLAPERQPEELLAFLTLAAAARTGPVKAPRPLTVCQLHLWVRELHGLLRGLGEPPEFSWNGPGKTAGLPPIVCTECGASGWAGWLEEGRLQGTPTAVERALTERDASLLCLFPTAEHGPDTQSFCSGCLKAVEGPICESCGAPARLLQAHRVLSAEDPARHLLHCPSCFGHRCLQLLALRAAELGALVIEALRKSDPRDRLLALAETAQQASHRASFFAARSFRSHLRSALHAVLAEIEGQTIRLDCLASRLFKFWRERHTLKTLVACLTPPDMRDLAQYRALMGTIGRDDGFEDLLTMRLELEVCLELGFDARAEQSLEKLGHASVCVDPEALDVASASLTDLLRAEIDGLEQVPMTKVRHFLNGLLTWARWRGAIAHPLLCVYADQRSPEMLTHKLSPLLPLFSGRLPRFLSLSRDDPVFDSLLSGETECWPLDWAQRVLYGRLGREQVDLIYRGAVEELVDSGLLQLFGSRSSQVYALPSRSLFVERASAELVSNPDGHHIRVTRTELETWWGMPTLRFGGKGEYAPLEGGTATPPEADEELRPFLCAEHTSLLDPKLRERLEESFLGSVRSDTPQMLVCEPTPQLALDLGSLSVLLLCSLPANPEIYRQRQGRLGSRTGMALVVSVVRARPAELAWFGRPAAMLAGTFQPGRIDLDAPVLLRRHLLAYLFDCWARDDKKALQTPRNTAQLLAMFRSKSFPQPFLTYLRPRTEELLAAFLEHFEGRLSETSRAQLQAGSQPAAVERLLESALERAQDTIDSQRRLVGRLAKRCKAVERRAAEERRDKSAQVLELKNEMRQLRSHVHQMSQRYPLEIFAESGVLPNHGFPETVVALTSMLYGVPRPGKAGETSVEARQYTVRSGSGFRRLAPHSPFYAETRRVSIDQVETGGKHNCRIEAASGCPACGRELGGTAGCPCCGQADAVPEGCSLLRLDSVSAHSDFVRSLVTDSEPVRRRQRYRMVEFLIVGESLGTRKQAGGVALQFLPMVTVRQVNTGFACNAGVGEQGVVGAGFEVCRDCGVVKPPQEGQRARHRSWCLLAQKQGLTLTGRTVVDDWVRLYLYREQVSQALSWKPAGGAGQLPLLRAVLALGLWRRNVGKRVRLLSQADALYLVDRVPGGCGMLEQAIEHPDQLADVLRAALEALEACSCRSGCYGCLYASRGAEVEGFGLDSEAACQLIKDHLELWPTLEVRVDGEAQQVPQA